MYLSQRFSSPCQNHFTDAPHPFIHLPPTLHNVSLSEIQFLSVRIDQPLLHKHSFTYHTHYIMKLSHYLSFPLSVPFHRCSTPTQSPTTNAIYFSPSTSVSPCQYLSTIAPHTFIHLPNTLLNISLPVLQFPPVSTIPALHQTHSFKYHTRYIMFISQYFSIPL